mgnify:CR=1 FL=1
MEGNEQGEKRGVVEKEPLTAAVLEVLERAVKEECDLTSVCMLA